MKSLLALAVFGFVTPAFASGTYTGASFDVTTNVDGLCFVVTADGGNVNFGTYTGAYEIEATTYLNVQCNVGTNYALTLDYGQHFNSYYGGRNMYNATYGGYLPYYLYTDTSRSTPWESGVYMTSAGSENHSVVGVLPGGYSVSSIGSYSDTVTATLTW